MPEAPDRKARAHPWKIARDRALDAQVGHAAASNERGEGATSSALPDAHPDDVALPYAELQAVSNFTFLTGASHPDELVAQAAAMGYHAIALTDVNTLAGVVRAHVAAKEHGTRLVVGCRVEGKEETKRRRDGEAEWDDSNHQRRPSHPTSTSSLRLSVSSSLFTPTILLYPTDREAYARLCRLITVGRRRAMKGECELELHDVFEHQEGMLAAVVPPEVIDDGFIQLLEGMREVFDDDRLSIATSCLYGPDDRRRLEQLAALSEHVKVPLVATNDVHYHVRERRPLQDVVTCIRHGCSLDEAGFRLFPHGERYLKPPGEMHRLFADYPEAIERGVEIAERCREFNLDQLHYEYPHETCPPGYTSMQYLKQLTWLGVFDRYGAVRCESAEADRSDIHPSVNDGDANADPVASSHIRPLFTRRPDGEAADALRQRIIEEFLDDPNGVPSCLGNVVADKVIKQVLHEFELIDELGYAPYFLTVYDIVQFAMHRGILCQGRGAAANSAVCYCMGITAVDPDRIDLLFERFVSKERNEPPDIDVDFEHERREEVIQYIYKKYGRDRAALTAVVITYRGRSAIRDVGKAFGLSLDCVDRMAKNIDWFDKTVGDPSRLREIGINPDNPTIRQVIALTSELLGFPRHLSQHPGGFVLTERLLCDTVPIQNAAMEDRTVIEWDKDDIDALGLLKVDVLGLGMLTCIRKALGMIEGGAKGRRDGEPERQSESQNTDHHEQSDDASLLQRLVPQTLIPASSTSPLRLAVSSSLQDFLPPPPSPLLSIPPEDAGVYDMICEADTVGVFQIESRAQMTMLPRLKPRCYYDLVIEVAIVRPGPIQGNMVHPYLRRRNGEEPVEYGDERIEKVLGKTLGVPLFQEQAMSLAVVAGGFSPGEADQLRRAIGAWRSKKHLLEPLGEKLVQGMIANGYDEDFAQRCYQQIQGFGEYGFPESHAASFALLVYVSAWIKRYHPAAFAAGLINSQPMGFYAPAQIVRDAKEHGVEVRAVDVNWSGWDCCLEKRRRDEETKRRSKREAVDSFGEVAGHHGACENIPGSDCVAEGDETDYAGVSCDATDAGRRAVRLDQSNAPFSSVDSIEHCRGIRQGNDIGPRPLPARREGIVERTVNADRTDHVDVDAPERYTPVGTDRRNRSRIAGTDQQPQHWLNVPSPTSSLHDSALRLGFRLIKGMREDEARKIEDAVAAHGPFDSIEALRRVSKVKARTLRVLAKADAFGSMGLDRQSALWHVRKLRDDDLPLFDQHEPAGDQLEVTLPQVEPSQKVLYDYASTGLSLKAHPVSFLRAELDRFGVTRNGALKDESAWPHGRPIAVAGQVLVRQRPGTASGVVFMTIEDETGVANLIVRPKVYKRFRKAARHSVIMLARGWVERKGKVVHVMVRKIEDFGRRRQALSAKARNFH